VRDAYAAIHEHGVVHGDVQPRHVVFEPDLDDNDGNGDGGDGEGNGSVGGPSGGAARIIDFDHANDSATPEQIQAEDDMVGRMLSLLSGCT